MDCGNIRKRDADLQPFSWPHSGSLLPQKVFGFSPRENIYQQISNILFPFHC